MKIKQYYINQIVMIIFGLIIFQLAYNLYSNIHYAFIYSGIPATEMEKVLEEHILQIRTVISNFALLLMIVALVFVGIEIVLFVMIFRKEKSKI